MLSITTFKAHCSAYMTLKRCRDETHKARQHLAWSLMVVKGIVRGAARYRADIYGMNKLCNSHSSNGCAEKLRC